MFAKSESESRVTEKTLGDLELLAIQAPNSKTIHVMKVEDHEGWAQGDPGATVCGRRLGQMYLVQEIRAEDKPCKLCERTQAVIAIMFETSEVIQKVIAQAEKHNEQMAYMSWLSHGMHFGYISPPFCGLHNEVPLTQGEIEAKSEGEETCAYIVRVYGMSDVVDEFGPDEIP